MMEVTFKINQYYLEQTYTDESTDFSFLDSIGERYDFTFHHSGESTYHEFRIILDEGYNEKVALKDILTVISDISFEFSFKMTYYKPAV